MNIHCLRANSQDRGDLVGAAAFADHLEHFEFAITQFVKFRFFKRGLPEEKTAKIFSDIASETAMPPRLILRSARSMS